VVFESIQGGDMVSKLGNKLIFSEKKASKLIDKIVHIISYLHTNHIIHANIKAEDFYFEDKKQKPIKLCSFDKAHNKSEKKD